LRKSAFKFKHHNPTSRNRPEQQQGNLEIVIKDHFALLFQPWSASFAFYDYYNRTSLSVNNDNTPAFIGIFQGQSNMADKAIDQISSFSYNFLKA
jgi:hypothetical protein